MLYQKLINRWTFFFSTIWFNFTQIILNYLNYALHKLSCVGQPLPPSISNINTFGTYYFVIPSGKNIITANYNTAFHYRPTNDFLVGPNLTRIRPKWFLKLFIDSDPYYDSFRLLGRKIFYFSVHMWMMMLQHRNSDFIFYFSVSKFGSQFWLTGLLVSQPVFVCCTSSPRATLDNKWSFIFSSFWTISYNFATLLLVLSMFYFVYIIAFIGLLLER